MTKVVNKTEYIKAHPLTDKFGIPFEIGDYVASGGEFTTCDMPSIGVEEAKIDMIKLVGFE